MNNKRNFELTRKMGNYDVLQRTSDGFFDANALLRQWNANPENKRKSIAEIVRNKQFQEFAKTLYESESQVDNYQDGNNQQVTNAYGLPISLMNVQKGRNTKYGRTEDRVWMNPYLFIKFAMSLNPRFEVSVVKFVTDKLVEYRNEVADSYKHWSRLMSKLGATQKEEYSQLAKCMNYAVFGCHKDGIRDYATYDELVKLRKYEADVEQLFDFGMLKNTKDVKEYLKKVWMKNFPNEAVKYLNVR